MNTNCLFDILQGRKKIIFTYTNLALKNFSFLQYNNTISSKTIDTLDVLPY